VKQADEGLRRVFESFDHGFGVFEYRCRSAKLALVPVSFPGGFLINSRIHTHLLAQILILVIASDDANGCDSLLSSRSATVIPAAPTTPDATTVSPVFG
jgi:hypothetical protein